MIAIRNITLQNGMRELRISKLSSKYNKDPKSLLLDKETHAPPRLKM